MYGHSLEKARATHASGTNREGSLRVVSQRSRTTGIINAVGQGSTSHKNHNQESAKERRETVCTGWFLVTKRRQVQAATSTTIEGSLLGGKDYQQAGGRARLHSLWAQRHVGKGSYIIALLFPKTIQEASNRARAKRKKKKTPVSLISDERTKGWLMEL